MHQRNKLRLLAGLTIDHSLETTQITEARSVPLRKGDLAKKTPEAVRKHIVGVIKAIAHLKNAVKALERIPAYDFNGEVPYYINNIEEIISTDNGDAGMESYLSALQNSTNLKEGSAYPGCENEESSKPYSKDAKGKTAKKKFPGEEGCGNKKNKTGKQCMSESEVSSQSSLRISPKLAQYILRYQDQDELFAVMNDASDFGTIPPQDLEALQREYDSIAAEQGLHPDDDFEQIYEEMYSRIAQVPAGKGKTENEETTANGTINFAVGDKVLYDNGIWIVHIADAKADLVGIIPPGMKDASKDEKAKVMQQVKSDKLRKPSDEESKIMAGPDGILGTADDKMMGESTHNYAPGNALSHEETDSDPINVVSQADKQWANSLDPKMVRNEYTSQLDDKGDQSMDDEANKVKVPNKITKALKDAIDTFIADAEKIPPTGHTAQEKRQFMIDTAEAFNELLGMLKGGTIMDIKKAQVYATSLMGPMLHKLPDGVWDFISNGGQKRSLRDYMNKVEK